MIGVSQVIPELDRRGLRNFGLTTGLIVAVIFGLFFPWVLSRPSPWWPWLLCAALAVWALTAPNSMRLLYLAWMRFGLVMGRITTPIVLGLMFFLIVTPVAWIRVLFGLDSMARSIDATQKTYRIPSVTQSAKNMEEPF
jgi:hypothetical protein